MSEAQVDGPIDAADWLSQQVRAGMAEDERSRLALGRLWGGGSGSR